MATTKNSKRKTVGRKQKELPGERNGNICLECESLCCKDLAVMITRPRSRAEIDELKWQLHFDTVRVFIRNHRWHLLTKGRCIYLSPENLCTIYDCRSEICREHQPPNCERYGEYYDVMIETPEELEAHLVGVKKR
jgi:Fe-S-cluster containining protein